MSHDISSSDGLDQCFANPRRNTIALPTMEGLCACGNRVSIKVPYKASASSKRRLPLSPAKVSRFLLEFVLLRIQNSTSVIGKGSTNDRTFHKVRGLGFY